MQVMTTNKAFDFVLPKTLECTTPTEERRLPRDATRLMISDRSNNKIVHSNFNHIASFLEAGDVLIVNTSATLNAALKTTLPNGREGRVHLSTPLENNDWLVEIRQVVDKDTKRYYDLKSNQTFELEGGGKLELIAPFYNKTDESDHIQLWKVAFILPISTDAYLAQYGYPIKYFNIDKTYPLSYYQTVFAQHPGSSEMPSAGRAFTPELVTQLVLKGVQIAPILLHTGISSLEVDEAPYPEYFEVSDFSANLINKTKKENKRIIAVGTTAIRAIESAVNSSGQVESKKGMTNLYITPERGLTIVNGMLTGFHEPKASHLLMMEALADKEHLSLGYTAAVEQSYYWHEFGDLHLLL